MKENWFFRWVWRFNAIALALVLTAAAIGIVLPFFVWQWRPTIETLETITEAPGTPAAKHTELRLFLDFTREGRREIVFALAPEAKQFAKFSAPGEPQLGTDRADTTRVANYLFVDPATGAARWLFPTNNQVVTATDYLTKNMSNSPAEVGETSPTLAVAYTVKVAERAGATAAPPKYQLYVSRLDGTDLTKVLDDVDATAATFVPAADNTIFATYKLNGRHMIATVSLTDFKVLMTKDLSEYEPK